VQKNLHVPFRYLQAQNDDKTKKLKMQWYKQVQTLGECAFSSWLLQWETTRVKKRHFHNSCSIKMGKICCTSKALQMENYWYGEQLKHGYFVACSAKKTNCFTSYQFIELKGMLIENG